MNQIIFLISPLLLLLFLSGCNKDEKSNDEIIREYLSDHNINATKHESGLYYAIDNYGDSVFMSSSQSYAKVYYKGYFTDGYAFDQTHDEPFYALLSHMIQGWQIGIPLIPEGGKGSLFIPSSLGYGDYDYYNIPGGSVLIFDVEVVDFH